jgi:hypothetical protein
MKEYGGYKPKTDPISHGGAWVETHGWGAEMWNFLPSDGRVYGYVMSKAFAGINLARIASKKWKQNDEFSGIDIVFIARSQTGQVVVGWYKDATIFHRKYRRRPNPVGMLPVRNTDYLCEADAENAHLVREGIRDFKVPYAPIDGYGPGHSNVWYADSKDPRARKLVARLQSYIGRSKEASNLAKPKGVGGGWTAPDKAMLLKIERNSMNAVEAHFQKEYRIAYVHKDCCGWDMTATHKKSGTILQLEVKGHLGDVIQFELTPNEYRKMKELHRTYRVCVVRRALERSKVEVYRPFQSQRGDWNLRDGENRLFAGLTESVAARASEIN